MKAYHLDYETRCRVDIKSAGAARYAEDCEPILFAIAEGDGPVLVWQHDAYLDFDKVAQRESGAAQRLLLQAAKEAREGKALIYAHNVDFESYITRYAMPEGYQVPLEAWRCTLAMCRKAASPVSLKDASAFWLPSEDGKDAGGKALIRKFCVPDKGGNFTIPPKHPADAKARKLRAEWEAFANYCRRDVESERALHRKLIPFELTGLDLATFQATLRMNHLGVPIDTEAVAKALPYVEAVVEDGRKKFSAITGGILPTQREQFRQWLAAQGCPFEDLQKETIAEALEVREFPPHVADALGIYSGASFAAVAKLFTMDTVAMRDRRARGQFVYHGAGTGRWAATGIQPQNMRKPTVSDPDASFALVRAGGIEHLDLYHDKPLEGLASCVRNFIGTGGNLCSCDFAAIEARVVCWLASQQDALDDFVAGNDRYCRMAAVIYGMSYEAVVALGKKSKQRQLGKTAVLGCGFGMGGPKFSEACKKQGVELLDALADKASSAEFKERLAGYNEWARNAKRKPFTVEDMLGQVVVDSFRGLHPEVVRYWRASEDAARNAVSSPGHWFPAGRCAYMVCTISGEKYLVLRLPSGRRVYYLRPDVKPELTDDGRQRECLVYWGQHPTRKLWCHLKLYGGLMVENATQAVAADIMANGLLEAERAGVPPFALIHDEAVASAPEGADHTLVRRGKAALPAWAWTLQDALVKLPSWAHGLPIEAEAEVIPYYKK